MSEPEKPKDTASTPAPAPKKGGGVVGMVLGMVLPPLLAAAASYGAVRASAHAPPPHVVEVVQHVEAKPPGPTVALDPFLVSVVDAKGKGHPMKLSVAVEFGGLVKEDALKAFVPRIRDAILAHMRTLTFEEAVDSQHSEKLRTELLERCQKAGASGAERILITDLVSQ
jgi:flagellar basal body-associated protein FliL